MKPLDSHLSALDDERSGVLAPSFHLSTPALTMEAAVVPWDTALLGYGVGQIDRIVADGSRATIEAYADFEGWRNVRGLRMVACRLSHTALRESMFLESRGFRFVEMVYPLSFDAVQSADYEASIALAEATDADLDSIQEIAGQAFATGRFNVDPRLGQEVGGKRYAGWVRNSLVSPSQQIIKACVDKEIVAFFIVEPRGSEGIYWHLTAVSPSRQGQGLGQRIWRAVIMRHRREGLRLIETTISARNTPVVNLYARLGFRFQPPLMTFHWLREDQR